MKRFSEQLYKKSQSLKLKKSEQADLRDRIVSYMEYHPLPADMKAAPAKKKAVTSPVMTEVFALYQIPFNILFKAGGVLAVFVLIIVPFMAERTVPGDTLYAVKVQFNEEVRSTLTWGSYEKVEWETERLNRRIAEARLLADEGLLTQEVEAEVAAAVKEHSDNAKREIEALRASDADEATIATIAFESSLAVQAQALEEDEVSEEAVSAVALISEAIDESRAEIPQTASTSVPAFDKLMARVELNTTRVLELRESLAPSIGAQDLADVTRRIDDINRAVAEAVDLAAIESTEFEARVALTEVLARTQKLIVFMTELKVREEVTIEEVVPVVPTDDEIAIDHSERTTRVEVGAAQLTAGVERLTDEFVAEKVADIITRLAEVQAAMQAAESHEGFVAVSDEADALIRDGLLILEQAGINPAPVVPDVDLSTSTEAVATSSPEVVIEAEASTSTQEVVAEASEEVVVEEDPEPAVEDNASSTEATTEEFD